MPTRREFLKLSAAAAAGVALWGCKSPDKPIVNPTEKPTQPAIPTKKVEATDTPNVPATKEAERLNAVLAEGYPTKFEELTAEKMLSEKDFLEQLKKFPNVTKEYAQVKAMLSAGLAKEKVNLNDIAFEVSSFAWDGDKYSWIVVARNSKTGEVYIPRDGKTHTRNIDMSVYGYLKEYQAGGALPFTMEKLKLPEFSGPEYKVGFARSKNGWLVATLDGGPQKGWYDFRDEKIAKWKDEKNVSLLLKTGINVEDRSEEGLLYTSDELVKLEKLKSSVLEALKTGKILQVKGIEQYNRSGECEPIKDKNPNITLGMKKCFRSDGSFEKVSMAWDAPTGSYLLPTEEGIFVRPARYFETGQKLVFDEISYLDDDIKGLGLLLSSPTTYRVEFPNEKLVHFAYRRQSELVSVGKYKRMMLVRMLNPRPAGVERISWAEVPLDIDTSSNAVAEWAGHLFDKDAGGKYVNISVKDSSGKFVNLSSKDGAYKLDEPSLKEAFNMVGDLPESLRKCTMANALKIYISAAGITAFNWRQSISEIQLPPSALIVNDSVSKKYLAVTASHEFGAHALQFPDTSDKRVDCEFQAYVHSLIASKYLDFQDFSRTNFWRQLLQFGSYLRA